jgi:transposase
MYCSTSLQILPIMPCLPCGLVLLLILSLLLQTCHLVTLSQHEWPVPVPVIRGRWHRRRVGRRRRAPRRWRLPGKRWLALLPRLLVRCALFALLLQASGWAQATPLSWAVLLVPMSQIVALGLALTTPHSWARRAAHHMQRLYQLTLGVLLLSTLGQLLRRPHSALTGLVFPLALGTWRTRPDDEVAISITTLAENHYQVTVRGAFTLIWEPRDSFERWMLILFLRKLQRLGATRPLLTQRQVAEAFDTHQCLVSRWEREVHQHGWHVLSDRYRHQLRSLLPDTELSRTILKVWVPAFWLTAWDVRERLIEDGVIASRMALSLESLHVLARHTGFAQVRRVLLERFHLQDGQLIAKEHWWLKELLALNERLLVKLAQGQQLTPQETLDIEPLRLNAPPEQVEAPPSPPLAASLKHALFEPPDQPPDALLRCTYCGSDQVAPKSKKPRRKTVVDAFGETHQVEVLRYYCHNPACPYQTFTHLPPGLLPHSPYPLQVRLLAVEVYENLLSTYRRSARMLGVKASTVYHWVASLSPAALALAAYLGVVRTSGVIGIDDKWVKVCSPSAVPPHGRRRRAVWRYTYFAVDVYSYDLLALELYPQHNDQAVHLFLLELKAKGIQPRVVVTDLDPAYGRLLPQVFPRAVHHECIFHAIQNAQSQLTEVYGRYYRQKVPMAATLYETIVKLFRARTQKTVRKRFAKLMALRQAYVTETPEVACVFDSLERHFPKLVNAIENPLIPRTNNATELVIRRFDQHYQSMAGFDSFESARVYLRVFELVYRLTPFADDNPTAIRGKCPLELAGYDLETLPIADFFLNLKLPTLALPAQEVLPMA